MFRKIVRTIVMDSGSFYCPSCNCERSVSVRRDQEAFGLFGVRLSGFQDSKQPPYAECERCGGRVPGEFTLHASSQIGAYEALGPATHDSDEDLEITSTCPNCGRENGRTTTICPRCETRLG